MSIITLLTDFGSKDIYAGLMKGVIFSINPNASVVDLTHHVDPQDLRQAAFIIKSSYSYFPAGSVHVVVVDPGVGGRRAIIAVKMKEQILVAPDNGVLTLMVDEGEIDAVIRIENSDFFLKTVSRTFHGRDIFAPVAAHISMGVDLEQLGTPISKKDLQLISIPKPYIGKKNELVGTIVSIDRFGNCMTNIDSDFLEAFINSGQSKKLQVSIGQCKIKGLSLNYEDASPQSPLAVIGSFGYLEIAVNCGSAHRDLGAEKGDAVQLILCS